MPHFPLLKFQYLQYFPPLHDYLTPKIAELANFKSTFSTY